MSGGPEPRAPRPALLPRRLGEALLATWTVAGALIALVYSSGALRDAVHAASWLAGPALWVVTVLGAGLLLHGLPQRDYSLGPLALGALAGGGADALVVLAGHPWPGLVAGIAVFSLTVALTCRGGARAVTPVTAAPRAGRGG